MYVFPLISDHFYHLAAIKDDGLATPMRRISTPHIDLFMRFLGFVLLGLTYIKALSFCDGDGAGSKQMECECH